MKKLIVYIISVVLMIMIYPNFFSGKSYYYWVCEISGKKGHTGKNIGYVTDILFVNEVLCTNLMDYANTLHDDLNFGIGDCNCYDYKEKGEARKQRRWLIKNLKYHNFIVRYTDWDGA